MMGAATRFYTNQTRIKHRKISHHLLASELAAHSHFPIPIHTMYLEYLLCQINPNARNLHIGLLSRLTVSDTLQSGTLIPFRGRSPFHCPTLDCNFKALTTSLRNIKPPHVVIVFYGDFDLACTSFRAGSIQMYEQESVCYWLRLTKQTM